MNTPTIIKPTIGRKVWYHPSIHDFAGEKLVQHSAAIGASFQPFDATVIYVWGDRMVNLRISDHHGHTFIRTSVTLVQPGDLSIPNGGYACWMPYQTAQAAKQAEPAKHDDKVDAFVAFLHSDGSSEHYEGAALKAALNQDIEPQDFGIEFSKFPPTFAVLDDGRTTVCQLTLHNGFTVTGQSICASMEQFSMTVGREYALADAKDAAAPFLACIAKEREYLRNREDETPF